MRSLAIFFSGAFMITLFYVGVYFMRFWRQTKDPFFGYFTAAFWLLAAERIPLLLMSPILEGKSIIFVFRLLAFSLILIAIVQKNRSPV